MSLNQRARTSRPSFRPRLENLEARWCPAVTSFQDGDTLTLRGDNTADAAQIQAIGRDAYRVTTNGVSRNFFGVEEIRVGLFGGNDQLFVDFRADNSVTLRVSAGDGNDRIGVGVGNVFENDDDLHVIVDAGNGSDQFAFLATNIYPEGEVNLQFYGDGNNLGGTAGLNNDNVNLNFNNLGREAEVNAQVQLGNGTNNLTTNVGFALEDAEIDLDIRGGTGVDTINSNFGNLGEDASLELDINTGGGADVVNLAFGAFANDSETEIDIDLGDGNDQINWDFNAFAQEDAELSIELDGGAGFDTSRAPNAFAVADVAEVEIENMESVG